MTITYYDIDSTIFLFLHKTDARIVEHIFEVQSI